MADDVASETKQTGRQPEWDQLFDAELAHFNLDASEKARGDHRLSALCLSGGGVRSAVFCAGVLGELARRGLLSKFHYLSTVSGGGYAGAALTYWLTEQKKKGGALDVDRNCPFFANSPGRDTHDANAPAPQNLSYIRHLRANISYLMPTGFRGALIGAYVLTRSILINLVIWITLLMGVFWVILNFFPEYDWGSAPMDTGEAVEAAEEGFDFRALVPENLAFFLFALGGAIGLAVAIILMPVFSFVTYFLSSPGADSPGADSPGDGRAYSWRRNNEWLAGWCLFLALVCLPMGLLPYAGKNLPGLLALLTAISDGTSASLTLGVTGTVISIAIALFGLFRSRLGGIFGPFSSVTIVFGALLLLYSVMLLAYVFVANGGLSGMQVLGCFMAGLVLAWFCNINDTSIGRFYRDRLMEAFFPDIDSFEKPNGTRQPLARIGQKSSSGEQTLLVNCKNVQRPLHLINTNVMAWWCKDSRALRRKGDNFILSPVYCGSDITGWQPSTQVSGGKLTLATSMATSGAAVNPQGGFAGEGPTTSPVVGFAMSLLSLRLGFWLAWKSSVARFGNHITPGLTSAIAHLLSFSRRDWGAGPVTPPAFLELADGGHFDNLGVYEMLRRKCRVILVADGGHDPENSYDALAVLVRRARDDFGADIRFNVRFHGDWKSHLAGKPTGPQDLVARTAENEYPRDTDYAEKGYFVASITYGATDRRAEEDGYRCQRAPIHADDPQAPREMGILVYLKSAMIAELDLTTKGYRGANPLFPFDPTANQFFTPEQFEAYRDMGEKIAAEVIGDLEFGDLMEDLLEVGHPTQILARAGRSNNNVFAAS